MLGNGSSRCRLVTGKYYDQIGVCKTTNLALSAADANVGTIPRGKVVDCSIITLEMMYTTGFGKGLLRDFVDLYGTTGLQGFKDVSIGKEDLPKKKGSAVSIVIPQVGAILEFEGLGVVAPENLVCTSGSGKAIASNAALGTDLSVEYGCWKLAEAGEYVMGRLLAANLTPNNSGERRIQLEWVGATRRVPTP